MLACGLRLQTTPDIASTEHLDCPATYPRKGHSNKPGYKMSSAIQDLMSA